MKKYYFLLCFSLIAFSSFSQLGNADNTCADINANISLERLPQYDIPKRATFKIFLRNNNSKMCTGTLINRDVNQDNLGFFMVTASHCFLNSELDNPDKEYTLVFNYESPTGITADVPLSNQGKKDASTNVIIQSRSLQDIGYQYVHKTKLRLVANYTANVAGSFGDFIMFEILNPIPPHFNVAYAGWYPGFNIVGQLAQSYKGYHHPLGDVKKVLTATTIISATGNTTGVACRVITKLIDGVFRLFGGTKTTESACRFFELQSYTILPGTVRGGALDISSGSSLTSYDSKIIGTLATTTDVSDCFQAIRYNKFKVAYYRDEVRNTLNPTNNFWKDQLGMDGRLITCYSSLNNLNGEYFAGADYNLNSGIVVVGKTVLQSASTISTLGSLNIHPKANYSFTAANSITLNPGFQIVPPQNGENMGVFEAKIGGCTQLRNSDNDIPYYIYERAKSIQLPLYKPFDPQQYLNQSRRLIDNNSSTDIQVYPNPSSDGNFTLRFMMEAKKDVNVSFTDILGKVIYSTKFQTIQGDNYFLLDLSEKNLSKGIYFLNLQDGSDQKVKKVIIE